MRKEKPLNKDSILKAFKCIDKNGDGFITYDELFALLTKVCSVNQDNSQQDCGLRITRSSWFPNDEILDAQCISLYENSPKGKS